MEESSGSAANSRRNRKLIMPSDLPATHRLYEHRPKPFSNALTLDLGPVSLVAERGNSKQEFLLSGMEQLRLSYRPANTARLGFACKLRARDGKTLVFSNLTWRSMVETGRQDEDYSAFTRELVARIGKASPRIEMIAGAPVWQYWLFVLGFAVLAPALLVAAGYFALNGSWPVGVLTLGLLGWLAFYAREYLTRNRPRTFAPEAIPPEVMPKL
jgi:hypothetical protein